ncbi:MAG: DNA recombination protein RmuC [Rikenellaceae bacterium]|nr:DNA recombination protein RmuC [Rikenellaceae bacterium]
MQEIYFTIIGITAGAVLTWFFLRNKLQISARDLHRLNEEADKIRRESDRIRNELLDSGKENTLAAARIEALSQRISSLDTEIDRLREREYGLQNKIIELEKNSSELIATNRSLIEKNESFKKETEEMRERMRTEFENIANRLLEEKSRKFTELNRENIDGILKPLGENIENFRKKIDETYDKESKERFSLGREVEKLVQLNHRISEDANNLTNALKGSSKIQGDWGEMILENILERSGLTKNREYFIQSTLRDGDDKVILNEERRRMIPDVRVQYPDGRSIIIDSKVSLKAYVNYCSEEDGDACAKHCREHLASVKRHIDDLSSKKYQEYTDTLDFVMMFIPNEPAYLLVMKQEPELWSYAYNKGVLLMSPTNLITSLKLVEDLWSRDNQQKNAIEIAEAGARLYDKFVGFTDTMGKIGDNIRKAGESYNDAMSQLRDGRGNLTSRVEKLRELGVKAKKKLAVRSEDQDKT